MERIYTPEQRQVIDLRGRNLLVSAAAGSGKTAVLVERIVRMISEGEEPLDIDRLLVVTFTNAAAAEMKERISQAISAKLEAEPENEHLQKQATLIHNAQITTIDSFCLFVIRNNFNDIGLDPSFRVADEGERRLLLKDVLSEVLEACYAENLPEFQECVEYFSTGGRDQALEDAVLKLYDFAQSTPFPEDWLAGRRLDYRVCLPEELERTDWVREALKETGRLLEDCLEQLQLGLRICELPDGPDRYLPVLTKDKELLEGLRTAAGQGYAACCLAFPELAFGRLPGKRDDSVDPMKKAAVQQIRGRIKEQLNSLTKAYFFLSPEQTMGQLGACERAVSRLADVTLRFTEAFNARKREKNLIDFSDMEHLALEILVDKTQEGEGYEPTRTALDYRAHFAEILTDEYQDSNLVQELLLQSIAGADNRFMVGDVKQSIYRFRLARPEIFMDKYDSYLPDDPENCRIDLHRNFRSRPEVLESVNYIFRRLMRSELGGVQYDDRAALYPGAAYPDAAGGKDNPYRTELVLIGKAEKEERESLKLSARQQEAAAVAGRIKELAGRFPVTDTETGRLRPASYRDIVILLRAATGWEDEFRGVLQEEGIPCYVASRTGYFAANEIQTLLQLLRVLDNPLQDIPLFGVLHSCFGGFTDEELAVIRAEEGRGHSFYDALWAFGRKEGGEDDTELRGKVNGFLDFLESYRRKAVYLPIRELLQTLLRDTGYLNDVASLPDGEQRRANVEMLLTKAGDFEKTSYYGLFHFVRYMEQLERYDVDYGEANILDENADVVRIMSIHKSKGLEFPICFVCGLAKKFNLQDAGGGLIADVDLGVGVDCVDPVRRIAVRTLRRNVIAAKMRRDSLGEELRILYVAMTRAKEKLILTAAVDHPDKRMEELLAVRMRGDNELSYMELSGAGSYLDDLLAALAGSEEFPALWQACGVEGNCPPPAVRPRRACDPTLEGGTKLFALRLVTLDDLASAKVRETVGGIRQRERLALAGMGEAADPELMARLQKKFRAVYPHANLSKLYTKTTVSELKKAGREDTEDDDAFPLYEEEKAVPYLPGFLRGEELLKGAARGSAYHRVLELLDFRVMPQFDPADARTQGVERERVIREEIGDMILRGKLPKEYGEAVAASEIVRFLRTKLAGRMIRAGRLGRLHREQPFVLGLPADRLNRDFPPEELVLIQGIIDVWFEEDDGLVVADYKTDAVSTPDELIARYHTQLDYYAQALTRLTGGRVKEKMIYSFALHQEIML